MMLFLEDTNYNHLPCGDPSFGGGKRVACTLSCCEVVTTAAHTSPPPTGILYGLDGNP